MEKQRSDWETNRLEGEFWEEKCCQMMRAFGYVVERRQQDRFGAAVATLAQNGQVRRVVAPDLLVWSPGGPSNFEIKNKRPTELHGCFGLEAPQFEHLLVFKARTQRSVYVAIHDHAAAGGKHVRVNRLEDWVFAEVEDLNNHPHWSSHTRARGRTVTIHYWPRTAFRPLAEFFFGTSPIGPFMQAAACL